MHHSEIYMLKDKKTVSTINLVSTVNLVDAKVLFVIIFMLFMIVKE